MANEGDRGVPVTSLEEALAILESFAATGALASRIADLEGRLTSMTREQTTSALVAEGINPSVLKAALEVKRRAGQINVIVHAVGILVSLPHILEPGETVESLSLGAGNTGRQHDLETDRRVAEFKFIGWRGGPESIRQNSLFADLFNLASTSTSKRRVLYVVGSATPLRFLNNQRALTSVLSKNAAVEARFRKLHGHQFTTVREYYKSVRDLVEIVDLAEVVPALREL
jgi:hypothetical protein